MRAQARHQLKEDRFSKATIAVAERTADWSAEHRSALIVAGIIAAIIAAGILGAWYYFNQQDQSASLLMTQAVRTLSTSIRPAGMPAQPDFPSFASIKERATQAHKQFQEIVDKYPHTRSAEFARYFLGTTSQDLGDNASAERDLKQVADARNDDLAAMAKYALAALYRNSGRNKEAIDLYKQLMNKPALTVSKQMAQLALADTYQAGNQSSEAKNIYQQVQKESPASQAAQVAAQKLQDLK